MRLIHCRRYPVDHYVLVGATGAAAEPQRLLRLAQRLASVLARRSTGRPGGYTLIHNGSGVARRSDPHVHIVCTRTRFAKGLIYLLIGLKNLLPQA